MQITYRFVIGVFGLLLAAITLARAGSAQSVPLNEIVCSAETPLHTVITVSTGSFISSQLISPDGKKMVVVRPVHGHQAIFVMDRNGANAKDLTGAFSNNIAPAWSPDSQWVAFVSDRNGLKDLYLERIDGGSIRRLTRHAGNNVQPRWTPDGKQVVFLSDRSGKFARWTVSVESCDQHPLPAMETAQTPNSTNKAL